MNLSERIDALAKLGDFIKNRPARVLDEHELDETVMTLENVVEKAHYNNGLFTIESIYLALDAIAEHLLDRAKLIAWAAQYPIAEGNTPSSTLHSKVGLVMAGNIPLVGFHDVLCTFVAGKKAVIKLSDRDKFLLPYLLEKLAEFDPRCANYFEYAEQLKGFDAVIATGGDNTSRYFEYYFAKYPHIIRKNRHSVAVLTGEESEDDLKELCVDIFRYFGLGCRSVSKLYLPQGYDFGNLLMALNRYSDIMFHDKYRNNYDYHLALLMLNRTPHRATDSVLLLENPSLHSRIASLHYGFYENIESLSASLAELKEQIQCVVGKQPIQGFELVPFGQSQCPGLSDYPDGVDVMKFLTVTSNQ